MLSVSLACRRRPAQEMGRGKESELRTYEAMTPKWRLSREGGSRIYGVWGVCLQTDGIIELSRGPD